MGRVAGGRVLGGVVVEPGPLLGVEDEPDASDQVPVATLLADRRPSGLWPARGAVNRVQNRAWRQPCFLIPPSHTKDSSTSALPATTAKSISTDARVQQPALLDVLLFRLVFLLPNFVAWDPSYGL